MSGKNPIPTRDGLVYEGANVIVPVGGWQLVKAKRDPTSADFKYPIGSLWINTVSNNIWIITSAPGHWVELIVSGASLVLPANGGTGIASPTAHAVMVAEGAAAMTPVGPGTDGQVLTGNTAADPSFDAIGTKSGLTQFGVVVAEGAGAFQATLAGTNGQVLLGNNGANPSFGAVGVNSNLTGLVVGNTNAAFTATPFTAATSFTPAFALSTPGDSTWTYTSQFGRYTRIGAVVFFVAELVWNNFVNTTGSGTWQLNLPVTAGAFARAGQVHISGSGIDASAETANLPANFVGQITTGASTVILSVEEGGIGNAANAFFNLTLAQVKTAGDMTVSGFYFAA